MKSLYKHENPSFTPRVMFSLCFYHDALGTVFWFILFVFLLWGMVMACLLACLFVLRGKNINLDKELGGGKDYNKIHCMEKLI